MWGEELAIEEFEARLPHPFHERDETGVACVGHEVEHALPREGSPSRDAVEPTDEAPRKPRLDAVGGDAFAPAALVEGHEAGEDAAVDPRPLSPPTRAAVDHRFECRIPSDFEAPLPEGAAKPARDVEGIDLEDGTTGRGEPEHREVGGEGPRKDAGAIGAAQGAGGDPPPDGEEALFVRLVGWRKGERLSVEPGDHRLTPLP